MSLRKFMHPKNIYKKAADFKQLAVQYPEFRKVAIVDLSGKVKIDFKNEESLRVLTEVLLKHDFGLNVKIPPNKLVPTLPLRLNYILWLADLMSHASFTEMEEVIGIDIGTGSIAIYPLLFAKMYGTHMVGTEIDESSVSTALEQIATNNLQHLIKVLQVQEKTILKDVLAEEKEYHFLMCNPPFFEVGNNSQAVTKKLPPRNAPTGSEGELMIEGGERAFVTQMIEESATAKAKVKIYTTMLGRKTNLLYLIKFLRKKKIDNMTWTEFCQGHTKRWGLAWTFAPRESLDLITAPIIRKSGDFIAKLLRDQRPAEIVFPLEDMFSTFDDLIEKFQQILEQLNVSIKEQNLPMNDFDGWACELTAEEDTWCHARRKRRLAERQEAQPNEHKILASKNEFENKTESQTKSSLLVCNIFVDVIEPDDDETGKSNVKICMVFERGHGGKTAMETLRQYLINKLNVREYFQKHCCKPNTKKRKKLKQTFANGTCESKKHRENVALEENTNSS